MVHGNLINIHRNSEIFKPTATDEITILTYYFKELLGLGKKLIPTRLTSQSNEFCNLEAMVQVKCWRSPVRRASEPDGNYESGDQILLFHSSGLLLLPAPTSCGFLAHHLLLLSCSVCFDGNWVKMHACTGSPTFQHFPGNCPPSGDSLGKINIQQVEATKILKVVRPCTGA